MGVLRKLIVPFGVASAGFASRITSMSRPKLTSRRVGAGLAVGVLGCFSVIAVPGAASAASCNTAATGSWSSNCTVQQGDASHMVEVVQLIVQDQEVCVPDGVTVDGQFGPKTFNGVECFQDLNDLQVDGIVGPHTWGALQSALTRCSAADGWQYWSALPSCSGSENIRDWINTKKWYLLSPISHTWQRINTGAPS